MLLAEQELEALRTAVQVEAPLVPPPASAAAAAAAAVLEEPVAAPEVHGACEAGAAVLMGEESSCSAFGPGAHAAAPPPAPPAAAGENATAEPAEVSGEPLVLSAPDGPSPESCPNAAASAGASALFPTPSSAPEAAEPPMDMIAGPPPPPPPAAPPSGPEVAPLAPADDAAPLADHGAATPSPAEANVASSPDGRSAESPLPSADDVSPPSPITSVAGRSPAPPLPGKLEGFPSGNRQQEQPPLEHPPPQGGDAAQELPLAEGGAAASIHPALIGSSPVEADENVYIRLVRRVKEVEMKHLVLERTVGDLQRLARNGTQQTIAGILQVVQDSSDHLAATVSSLAIELGSLGEVGQREAVPPWMVPAAVLQRCRTWRPAGDAAVAGGSGAHGRLGRCCPVGARQWARSRGHGTWGNLPDSGKRASEAFAAFRPRVPHKHPRRLGPLGRRPSSG